MKEVTFEEEVDLAAISYVIPAPLQMMHPIQTGILNMGRQGLAYCFGIDLNPSLSRHFQIAYVSPEVVTIAAVVLRLQESQAAIGNPFVTLYLVHPELIRSALGRINEEVAER